MVTRILASKTTDIMCRAMRWTGVCCTVLPRTAHLSQRLLTAQDASALTTELSEPWLCSAGGVFVMTGPHITMTMTIRMGTGSPYRVMQ